MGKRKASSKKAEGSRKKTKIVHKNPDDLPWKTVKRPVVAGLDGDDGILELEEVEDVEVVYEETEGGRVARFNVLRAGGEDEGDFDMKEISGLEEEMEDDEDADQEPSPSELGEAPNFEGLEEGSSEYHEVTPEGDYEEWVPFTQTGLAVDEEPNALDTPTSLEEWEPYALHPQLLKTLQARNFLKPTPIQAAALIPALAGRDVVGVAQTGSGKTLAYGLPILHHLLENPHKSTTGEKRPVRALILAPTRELALQVSSHLNACLNTVDEAPESRPEAAEVKSDAPSKSAKKGKKGGKGDKNSDAQTNAKKPPPPVSVAALVGGMSLQKQKRILGRGVDVLVATPGRLWDVIQEDDDLARSIKNLKFLVLDEADRMIEAGHFAELDNVLRLTLRANKNDQIQTEVGEEVEDEREDDDENIQDGLQTFVFSATLSKDLQRNLKKRKAPGKSRKPRAAPASTLDDLLMRLDFRDEEPEVIDLSPKGGVVSTLKESKVECVVSDKDVYLYYFLLRYPGRSLVFLSAIDGIRRLLPLMELLEIKAFPLHSQLEQRQRLKNLDRFKSTPNCVLLATDIAARGLDIPAVDHVLHYQIPRSADAYIHRNGRTARANAAGFSMLMCAPDERKVARSLLNSVGRQFDDIPELPVERSLFDKLKARIQLAKQIDTAQHRVKKEKHERKWMREAADAMEVELDSDFMSDSESEAPSKRQKKAANSKTAALKAQLKELLAQPLVARGVSTKYITSGSRPIVDDLLAGESNESLIGLKKSEARNDLVHTKKKRKQPS
ncbi:DEAD-domain-containing protein [Schizophyllum commune H4-8]|uniref:DEAD-domain-containing protein n=1 Tax=Schizophyllum commune (strain H4-8 / FGSC 9210) TaxID=578458 RepID=UPI00215F26BC|nr:DEAD-domain-containing protein [Schizophyllum commune H4-8]KAI5887142.1 DEAD-domain-containing protein [Schizophyllum commune H4-8]